MKSYRQIFLESLLAEEQLPVDGAATPARPQHERDPAAVENFLDQGTDPNALDTEGLPEDISRAFENLKQDMSEFYHKVEDMRNNLMSANNPEGAILNRLTKFQSAPGVPEQYKQMALELKKLFAKAHESLGSIATSLLSNNIVADNVKSVEDKKNEPKM